MQWAVWIPLSNGGRSRYGVYECYEEAHRTAVYLGGVVERVVCHQPASRRAFFSEG